MWAENFNEKCLNPHSLQLQLLSDEIWDSLGGLGHEKSGVCILKIGDKIPPQKMGDCREDYEI